MHFKSNGTKFLSYSTAIKKILLNYTPLNSKIRHLPKDVWHNIFEYAKPQ